MKSTNYHRVMVATRELRTCCLTLAEFTMAGFLFAAGTVSPAFRPLVHSRLRGPHPKRNNSSQKYPLPPNLSAKCSPEGTSLGVPPNGWPRPLRRSAVVSPPSRILSTTPSVKPRASRSLPETTVAPPQILPSSSVVAADMRTPLASHTAWKSLRSRYAQSADKTQRGMPHPKKTE